MNHTFFIETMGCQMNKLDSELLVDQLHGLGYRPSEDMDRAGIIIFNTCSVRQHAEDKVISKIGQLHRRRMDNPDLVIAVVGCMAQRLGQQLIEEHRQIDIVCGPGQLHQFGQLLGQIRQDRRQTLALNDPQADDELESFDSTRSRSHVSTAFSAYVRVMRGCNKFCHYCVVPYVRGRENSRPIEHIVSEAGLLAETGVQEITLLGQTVNSYHYRDNGKVYGLADVLEKVHELPGLRRIRFVTSYPDDFDERIFQAMADLPKVCEYLHLPAQSGSDRILRTMNRRYTARQYLDLIERARQIVPNISIAGDFIVGYCDETEEDYQATRDLLQNVRYKNCFIFKYSPRPGTVAARRFADNVPEDVKRRRNTDLLDRQNEIAFEDNQKFVGQSVEVLIEGLSKKPHLDHGDSCSPADDDLPQLVGRTPGDHIVVCNGSAGLEGQIRKVKILKASALTLFGEALT